MAVIEPDTTQKGGFLIKKFKKIVKAVRSATGKVVSGRNAAINTKRNITAKKLTTKKPLNTLQNSKIKRIATLLKKSTQKTEEIASQRRTEAEAVKVAAQAKKAAAPPVAKRATNTNSVKQIAQKFVTGIRAKARAEATKASADIKAQVVRRASDMQNNASFSLKLRLEKLNGDRLASIVTSTRAEAGDTLKTLGSEHGTAANLLKTSDGTIDGCNTKIGKAGKDNENQLSEQSRNQDNIKNARLSDRERDRNNGAQDIENKSKLAKGAGENAATALEQANPMPKKIQERIGDEQRLIQLTPQKIADDRILGESSGRVAAGQKTKRDDTFSDAGGQINTRDKHDSARQSAAGDLDTHNGQLSSATVRKGQNEKVLEGVQVTHQKNVDGMTSDANTAVTKNKKNLDDANASATGPRTNELNTASTARGNKEGEIGPNATQIGVKAGEINTAKGHERNAKNDSDGKADTVRSTNETLSSQISTIPSVKKNRDDALADAESKRPARPSSDQTNANRRGTISSTDIPDQQRIKTRAEQGLSDANNDLTKTIPLKNANLSELAPMGGVRSTRLQTDSSLNTRKGDAEKTNSDAIKARDSVVADIKQKQAVGKAHRENSDAVNNLIQTRSLVTKQGISLVADKDVTKLVSTKQHDATTTGGAAAKTHVNALPGLTTTNKNLSDVNGKIKTAADDQVKQTAIRDDMTTGIPREKNNAAGLDAARRDIPSKIAKARSDADIAAERIKGDREGLVNSGADLEMANDAYRYFNDPLEPVQKDINTNRGLSTAAGNDAVRARDIFTAAADMGSKRRNNQAQADTGRQQAAKDIISYTRARDDAVTRKGANDTTLAGIQAKNKADMDAMNANANDAVKNNKKNLDDTTSGGVDQNTNAGKAAKARGDKEVEAETQGATTASKLKEVNTARTNEGLAKKANDDDINNVNTQQANLNKLVGDEASLKADRSTALATAEASRPARKPDYPTINKRNGVIQDTDLPAVRKTREDASREHDRLVDLLEAPGGLKDERYFGDLALDDANTNRAPMINRDNQLRTLFDSVKKRLSELTSSRDGIGASIANGNQGILRRSQHSDNVNTIITSKKGSGVTEPPAKVQNDFIAKQTTSGNIMTSSGKQHAISKGSLDNSAEHIKGIKANIDGDITGGNFSKQKRDLEENINRESANRQDRMGDMNGGGQQINKLKKDADDASNSANNAANNRKALKEKSGGIDDLNNKKGAAGADIDAKKAQIKRDTDNADAAGKTAGDANSGRNSSASDADKIKGSMDGHDANRRGEFGNTKKYQGEADAARQRKIGDDTNLDNVKAKHKAATDKMTTDADGEVAKHKKGVDDGEAAASDQYTKAKDATAARKGAEEDLGTNGKNIDDKTKEVNKARENELAAKQKNDADRAAVGSEQKNLDAANLEGPPSKKNRDDAADAANDASPTRSPADSAKKQRQSGIDGEIDTIKKQKDDASDAKADAADDANRAKAEKDALPDPDDTTDLRNKNDDLQKKQKDEQDNLDDLEAESGKNKKKIEQSEFQMMKNQIIVGIVAGMITDMIHGKTTFFDPPPIPPYITGAFVYTIPTASGSVITNTSGPAPALVDLSGNPEILPEEIDIAGLGNMGPMGPISSGASGASGASQYTNGKVAGTQDGTRDGTNDATNVFLNGTNKAVQDLENKIGMLEYAKEKDIEKEVTAQSQEAYCKKVGDEGVKQKLDIYKVFSECSAYFKKKLPMVAPPVLEKLTSPTAESGASESGAQEGGYMEDMSGVMQFGGVLTNSGPDPVYDKDIEYMNGYRSAYKAAYTQAYSLTFAIKLTQKASQKKTITASAPGYGEVLEGVIKKSMPKKPITEASARGPRKSSEAADDSASGAADDRASGVAESKTITEASANNSGDTSGPSQVGGFIKLAKRSYQRGKTLTQHARLLNKIKGKTSVA